MKRAKGERLSPEPGPRELELDERQIKALVQETMDRLLPHLRGLATAPTHRNDGARRLARSLREELPQDGAPLEVRFEAVPGWQCVVVPGFGARGGMRERT